MDTQTLIMLTLAVIAIGACGLALHQRFRVIKLETLFGATYQLAGALIHAGAYEEYDNIHGKISDEEFDAGCELLQELLCDPDSPAARELVNAPSGESYEAILNRAKAVTAYEELHARA